MRRLIWLFVLLFSFLEPISGSRASDDSADHLTARWTNSQSWCVLVELHPGYPGYRGLESGLVGYAETACSDELEQFDPTFSREEQDKENRRIAIQLGIPGSERDWTWEAWMAIAAARGYGDICYSCHLLDSPMPIVEGTGALGPDDPRVALSSWLGFPQFATQYFQRLGVNNPTGFPQYMQDRWLRPISFAIIAGVQTTNSQLLQAAEKVTSDYFCLSGNECLSLDGYDLACFFIERGGYVEPTPGMHWVDRTYILTMGLLAASAVDAGRSWSEFLQIGITQYFAGLSANPQTDPVDLARTAFTMCG